MGHLPHFVHLPPRGLRCAALDYADLVARLLVASRNAKKLAELRRVLDAASLSGLTLVSLDDVPPFDEAPETGATFEDNALAKARDGFAATGLPTVADDSGLEVAALNGMPGVLSARGSGTQRAAAAGRGCARRGGRAHTATTSATRRCCWRSCVTCPMSVVARPSSRPAHWCPVRMRSSSAASGPARSLASRAAMRASATTRCSSQMARIALPHS